ncbi:hypothetical protein HWV62_43720 [Athelia sp. TMB]|nr:hypothetical protein HWV62_43720 [Athelia sp. TMB]
MSAIRVSILTISDTASRDVTADKSGPAIRSILEERGFDCRSPVIVPDDEEQIKSFVKTCAEKGDADWIVTTGGTGFGIRDKTPEAVSQLIERDAPGLVHLMISTSLKHTPLAALSRPVAGTIGTTLVVTLPGSVKAVKENLEALITGGVVNHAIDLIKGGTGQRVHKELAAAGFSSPTAESLASQRPLGDHGHHHHHHHSHSHAAPRQRTNLSHDPSQPGVYEVLTSQTHSLASSLPGGAIHRINTGGPLPAGSDTVIMVEDTRLVSTFQNGDGKDGEERQVETLAQIPPGENVRLPGSDVKKGDLVLQKGEIITSVGGEIGTLAFVGRKEVEVFAKPIVALLSTGNEIVDLQNPISEASAEWGGIYDTNRPSLQAALEGMGYTVVDLGIVPDDVDSHVATIKKGLEQADILLTTGGTSMGPADLLKPVIERHLGGTVHFGRVTIKPGKPTTFASIPTPGGAKKFIFALPGNPASAVVTFHVFVVPALRRLGGWPKEQCQLPRIQVQLKNQMRLDPRTEFHRVVIRATKSGLTASSTGGQRSSRVASLSGANGLVILPPRTESGPQSLAVDEVTEAIVVGEIQIS